MSSYILAFLATSVSAIALIYSQDWHGWLTHDTAGGVQNHHEHPTPRIGGIAVFVGLFVAWYSTNNEVKVMLGPILLAATLAFGVGFLEDITKRVGVTPRLLVTMLSGVLAWYLTDIAMRDTRIPALDWALQFTPVAVMFTAFAVGGVSNAINIIDGFNGLASGAVAILLTALGLIALKFSDPVLANACFLIATCALGFLVVNWPLGKLFLGDGGAYLLGFLVAWMAVLLPMRIAEISAWTTLMVCAYPVLEVAFSVARKRRREGHHPGQPDKAHLHHFLNRRVVRKLFPHMARRLQNGLTAPLCWFVALVPATWGYVFAGQTGFQILGLALSTLAYAALYARLTQFRWCFSTASMRPAIAGVN